MKRFLALVFATVFTLSASADETKKKRLLLITDSGGFVHDSVGLAEEVLKEIGPKSNVEVTCYRFTRDPDEKIKIKKKEGDKEVETTTTVLAKYSEEFRARTGKTVEKENCGRVNAETLKNFDCVLFFTTGNPLNESEVKDLAAWVKAGGALAGTHCGTDTLYPSQDRKWNLTYGEMMGGYFDGHPWHQKIKIKVEDAKHPAGSGFKDGDEITDEIYQFRPDVYNRDRLHIIMSVDNSSIDTTKGKRADKDYAIAWCQNVDKGRSFYTSLGHRKEVWKDPRYQEHLMNGLLWTMKVKDGDATPSSKLPK